MAVFVAVPLARWVQPSPWIGKMLRRGALLVLGLGMTAVVLDDVQLHRTQPRESAPAHAYIDGVVHNDPAQMWDAYSPRARQARGGERDLYIAYMLLGTHSPTGNPNQYRLVARVPLDDDRALLYYQVDIPTATGGEHVLFPVVLDAQGLVDDAASDGVSFVPPRAAPPTAPPVPSMDALPA